MHGRRPGRTTVPAVEDPRARIEPLMADDNGNQGDNGHLLFVWSPAGWTLQPRDGDPPALGEIVEAGEAKLRISKLGPSPLPGDRRRCAYTELG